MGIEPFLVTSSVNAIVAQRLVAQDLPCVQAAVLPGKRDASWKSACPRRCSARKGISGGAPDARNASEQGTRAGQASTRSSS
ncbi:MAG: hypothetical protein M0C28_22525 [Candidatus Moduliflexus flocculans]|nr:hypothetical protein [Candidatus Moduliflexus flocculans]